MVGSKTGNIDLIGISGRGDVFCGCDAGVLARTSVAAVENAGDTVRFGSGLAVGDLWLCVDKDGDCPLCIVFPLGGVLCEIGDGPLERGGDSKICLLR